MIIKMASLDWRAMKLYHKLVFLTPLYFFIFGMPSSIFVVPFGVLYCAALSTWAFSVEDKGDLNRLYLTLSVKKREIVAGRYLLSLIMLIIGALMGAGIMFIVNNSNFPLFVGDKLAINAAMLITVVVVAYLLYAVYILCSFPLLFMVGYQKGKFFSIPCFLVIMLGLMAPIVILEDSGQESIIVKLLGFAEENLFLLSGSVFLAATVIFILSYFISVKVYSKREF